MHISAAPPRDVVADAIARVVDGRTWCGSVAELLAAIGAAAIGAERKASAWPRSPADLATCLRSQSDALRAHGLRMSIMPDDLLIERLSSCSRTGPEPPDRKFKAATPAA